MRTVLVPRHALLVGGSCGGLNAEFQRQHHLPLFGDAEVVEVDGAGHRLMVDRRPVRRVARYLRAFSGQNLEGRCAASRAARSWMMRVLVIGAHRGVGALAVDLIRKAGHGVVAFEGDVLDEAAVRGAMVNVDAVVSTLGPRVGSAPDLCARGTRHIVAAMAACGARRLVQVTGAMIGHPRAHLGWLYRFIESRVPAGQLADRREQERVVVDSGLDWTLIRPTRLTDGAARGTWRTGEDERVGALAKIARADVAAQIVRALDDPQVIGARLTLQY